MAAKKTRKPKKKPASRPGSAKAKAKAGRSKSAAPSAKRAGKPAARAPKPKHGKVKTKVAKPKAAKAKTAKPKATKAKAAKAKAKTSAKSKISAKSRARKAAQVRKPVSRVDKRPKVKVSARANVSAPAKAKSAAAAKPISKAALQKQGPASKPGLKATGHGGKAPPITTKVAPAKPLSPAELKRLNGISKGAPSTPPAAIAGSGKKRPALQKAPPTPPPPKPPPMREAPRIVPLPLPLLPQIRRPSVEERSAVIDQRLKSQGDDFRKRYIDSFDMSWIYHDSALEGVVYTFDELRAALGGQPPPMSDSSMQPTYDDIRRHKEAIDFVRDFGEKKRLPITLDVIKKIYLVLHPEEGDVKTVKYRKDIPQHRLYFHEYAPPDKIAYKVRQIVDWLNDPETKKTRNSVRIAARVHYDLLRVYPFATDSGKVARLFMNLLLMRAGLPPSILHSTERQRYYEALKGSANTVLQMVNEAVENALSSVEKLLDEHESKKRAFVS